ncbi:CbtA family protein [Catellatospora sp. NPDC049609]|uniref:CbtA family protein n=1 Tax=Catellatospora sp. NPDC049609 TaxID=3155505 RepID=UPI0034310800
MTLLSLMGRGGLAGACAGAASALVSLLLAEPVIDRAIELEHAAAGAGHGAELFTRDTQHVGLLVSVILAGMAIGLLFGLVYAVLHRRDPEADPWGRALRLAGAGFLGVSLLPFLRFPTNPPGVGSEATQQARTVTWLAAIVIGLATVSAMGLVAGRLARRGAALPVRHLAPVGVALLGLAVLFLLPSSGDEIGTPADLLWSFRLLSLLASVVLWAGLGVGFGLAGLRAEASVGAVAARAGA